MNKVQMDTVRGVRELIKLLAHEGTWSMRQTTLCAYLGIDVNSKVLPVALAYLEGRGEIRVRNNRGTVGNVIELVRPFAHDDDE